MQLLVIGGTHSSGRAMVEDAVARGHERDGLPSGTRSPGSGASNMSAATATAGSVCSAAPRGTRPSTPAGTCRASCATRRSLGEAVALTPTSRRFLRVSGPSPAGADRRRLRFRRRSPTARR